jgi:hypothetical protein
MDVQDECCCGIDGHKRTVVACVIVPGAQKGEVEKATRTSAPRADVRGALAQWVQAKGVTHVAMESVGVYGKPVFNLLEGHFTVIVVNAERIKTLRGRKRLRSIAIRAALSLARHARPSPVREVSLQKKREKGADKALCAVARKLLALVFVMLKKNLDYGYLEDRWYNQKLRTLQAAA